MKKVIKTKLIAPLIREPAVLILLFIAFLIGVGYAGGNMVMAGFDMGIWLGVLYIAALALYRLL